MLSNIRGKRLNTYTDNYVVFDLETTGVSCTYDRVIEISAIKVEHGHIVDEFSTLVNPEIPIPFAASQVNGITDQMVKRSPLFEDVLGDFLGFVGEHVLVGHNIHTFDINFIYRDSERFWKQVPNNDYVDTLRMARIYLPQLEHHRLTDLAEYYGISAKGAHRALNDCRMNQQVYEYLGREMKKQSVLRADIKICPVCGETMKKRNGRFGEFWGCSGYPQCRYTENV